MAEHRYSDDPESSLNKLINKVWADIWLHEDLKDRMTGFIEGCRRIYEAGFDDGEHFVWAVRQGGALSQETPNEITLTVSGSPSDKRAVFDSTGKFIGYEESPKIRVRNSDGSDSWVTQNDMSNQEIVASVVKDLQGTLFPEDLK